MPIKIYLFIKKKDKYLEKRRQPVQHWLKVKCCEMCNVVPH